VVSDEELCLYGEEARSQCDGDNQKRVRRKDNDACPLLLEPVQRPGSPKQNEHLKLELKLRSER